MSWQDAPIADDQSAAWMSAPEEEPPSLWERKKAEFKSKVPAPYEAALSAITGFGGTVAGGIAGLAGGARSFLPGGREFQGADWARATQDALTYEPQSESAKKALHYVGMPFEWLAKKADEAGGGVAEATGSPALGAGVNSGINFLPNLIAPVAKGVGTARQASRLGTVGQLGETRFPEPPPAPTPVLTPEQIATRRRAKELGYELTPGQETGKSWQTNLEAAMRTGAATSTRMQQMEARNRELTNRLVRDAEDLSGGAIDQGTAGASAIAAMKAGAEREVGKTGAAYKELLEDVPVNLEAQRGKLEAIRKDQQRLPPEQRGGKGIVELDTLLGDAGYVAPTKKGFSKPAIDINADDVVAAVRKLGGISAGDEAVGSLAKLSPFPPDPRLGPVWAQPKYASSTATNTVGGHSLDRMAQKLHELGYIDEVDPNLVMQALQDSSAGLGQKFSIFREAPTVDPLANAIEGLTKQLGEKNAPAAPQPGYIRENPVVSGATAQDLRSAYGSSAEAAFERGGKVQEGAVYSRMKSAVDDAIVSALPKEKITRFADLNEKYGLDMAVKAMAPESQQAFLEQLYRGAPDQFYTFLGLADPQSFSNVSRGFISRIVEQATSSETGNINAALLGRILDKYAKAPDVKGAADVATYLGGKGMPLLRDVGKIGTDVLREKVGDSGTTPRSIFSALLSGGGAASGLALGGSLASFPGAAVGALIGNYFLPKGIQSLYLSDMMRGRLTGKGSRGPSLGSRFVRGLDQPGAIAGLETLGLDERRKELLMQLLEQEGALQ